jgi:hypothetical protein
VRKVVDAIKFAATARSWDAAVCVLRLIAIILVVRFFWRMGQPIWDADIRDEYAESLLGVPGVLCIIALLHLLVLAALVWVIYRRLQPLLRTQHD